MIAYKIQLQYVIQDQIQSKTKFSLRKNLRKNFFCWKKILSEKENCQEKICLEHSLGFPVHKVSCLGQINAYHH